MNGWDFDWLSFAIGALAGGFLNQAGRWLFDKGKELLFPPKPKPKSLKIKPDFSNAPEHIKEKRLEYIQKNYRQTWAHPSDRSELEEAGFFAPLTHLGEEVSTEEEGQIKIWLVKERETP